ncbi:TonB family protein [Uliginosibacterium sp. 31-16]|uniref:energy transducer TonB n=1 Tax=Uliginosibacterium sp. 31-16 TaxID=3068315 RepID=UPI00273D2FF5|nr:energy transducer TonB [Uliginosibacterium sp. 31-16]MDP5239266.1 TonB family protein [Uliginosibacterium sp. 31-16]
MSAPNRPPRVLKPTSAQAPATQVAKKPRVPAVVREMKRRESEPMQRVRQWMIMHALVFGIGFSALAHGLLLATHFINPDGGLRKQRDQGLQVVLVNAKHKRAPKDAQALAQANLDGGGEQADQKNMPTSPLPPQDATRDGDALVETQQKVQQLETLQRELLARNKATEISAARERQSKNEEQPADTPQPKGGLDLSTKKAIARQEAVVEKSVSDYAARPKKGFISPRTREYNLAQYGEAFRMKLERVGELNFPRGERGSLYGSVLVSIEIRPDGSLASVDVVRPDRNTKLNEAALRIIKLSAPFAAFPPDIRKEYDILVLTRTMRFTTDDISIGQ